MRAAGLVCLGGGAGLIRADLRGVRGTDIRARSGGGSRCVELRTNPWPSSSTCQLCGR